MKRWTVLLTNDQVVVDAERMTITDGGTLIFWIQPPDDRFCDAIHRAFADGTWLQVKVHS